MPKGTANRSAYESILAHMEQIQNKPRHVNPNAAVLLRNSSRRKQSRPKDY